MDFDFDSILDKSIDDLKDLPSFTVPATGVYGLRIQAETKAINDKPAVILHYTVRHIVELADSNIPEADRAKEGDKFDVAIFLKDNDGKDSEIGWGRLKEQLLPYEEVASTKSVLGIVKYLVASPVDITAKVVKKQRKDDAEKFEARVSDVTID